MKRVTIAKGDGIGPEIMDAVLSILEAAKAPIAYDEITVGKEAYEAGHTSGIAPEDWDIIAKNKIFLKAPITTPQGGGYKSLNVTLRKTLGLFSNVRPCRGYHPFVETLHPSMDLVIIRENEEDLYAGIEHQQTPEVTQCLKLISRPGCEKIIRYAFEYARANNRKRVTCFSKDNIMKLTDGMFHKIFDEIAPEYPDIKNDHFIVDIGAARIADTPENFDVVVMPNLYGDIISDITGQISGSVGLAGSSNIGMNYAMFEAIHGSAPDISGKNIANPSGLLQGALLMLQHLGMSDIAETIQNAWLTTIEEGLHTADIYNPQVSKQKVGTKEFAEAVVNNLGKKPNHFAEASFPKNSAISVPEPVRPKAKKRELLGSDIFVYWEGKNPDELGDKLAEIATDELPLTMITNRGIKVYPNGFDETFCTDHWRCRFMSATPITYELIHKTLEICHKNGIDIIKTEHLYQFDGVKAFSMGQGQ